MALYVGSASRIVRTGVSVLFAFGAAGVLAAAGLF
jgi:L-asparagine transporter-like permease